MGTLRYTPLPFADLCSDLATLLRTRRKKPLSPPMAHQLGTVLERHLSESGYRLSGAREAEIEALPDRDRGIAHASIRQTLSMLRRHDPASLDGARFPAVIRDAAVRTGERVMALRMAGEPGERVDALASVLTELVQEAYLRGVIRQTAATQKVEPALLAPAIFAALAARENEDEQMTASEALDRFRLTEGAKMSRRALSRVAEAFSETLNQGGERISRVVGSYVSVSNTAFNAEPEVTPGPVPAYRLIEPAPVERAKPWVRMGTLIAFAASARGGGDEARVEGALEIYRSVVSVVQGRRARRGDRASRHSLMRDAIAALRFLSATVQEEQGLYRDVEARWKEIEKEMEKEAKFLQRGWKEEDGPMPQAVYPFPDEFTAVEARALYIQNATGRGVPLGVILQELYDSPQLTFGPTERQFFERIAFYGARKYSSDLTVQSDLRVEGVSTRRVRVEVVRQALHAIEVQLREHEYLTDDALIETGDRLIRDALVNGDLRREEMSILLGLQEPLIRPRQGEVAPAGSVSRAMVARIRARQEVRLLTAVLAAEGEIPRDVIESYRDLPHTRYHALSSLPEMRLRNQIARNGESLFDLENSTRARWMRFRLQEASHQDVNVLEIPNGNLSEAEANPMRVQMKRRPFRKKMPEVESRVEEKRTQGTGRRR